MKNGKPGQDSGSIVGRLALLYTLSTSVLLAGVALSLYVVLASNLREEDKQFLVEKVLIIKNIVQENGGDLTFLEQEIQRGIATERIDPYYVYFSRIFQSNDAIVIETPGMTEIAPIALFPEPSNEKQQNKLVECCVKWKARNDRRFFLLSVQSPNKNGQIYVIQVALDISREEATLIDYRNKLLLFLPIGIILSGLLGALVARRGLLPLHNMTLAAKQITANKLYDRIDPAMWPRELTLLAEAFNQMLERLDESFSRLNQFSADLAHEFRTPINNLMIETEVTLGRFRSKAEYREVLESGLEECGRLARMIDGLLFLARADNAKVQLQLKQFDVRRELEAICESYRTVIEEQGVTTQCEGESSLIADPILFRRAITNLLANAIRYASAGGQIKLIVETCSSAHSVAVRVSDSGCGIAQEHLPKIFDRFYRVDQARSNEPNNAGLGLAIVKSILAVHGGRVSIESQLGKGTTVTLHFPSDK